MQRTQPRDKKVLYCNGDVISVNELLNLYIVLITLNASGDTNVLCIVVSLLLRANEKTIGVPTCPHFGQDALIRGNRVSMTGMVRMTCNETDINIFEEK